MNEHPLKIERKKTGQTLTDVASRVGTDTGNLSRIESGRQMPSPGLLLKLIEIFPGLDVKSVLQSYEKNRPDKAA